MEISVQGKQVFYASGGRAHDVALPWIVFIHGATADHTLWSLQARYFAHHGRNVVALDIPGHGRSAGPPLTSVEDLTAWLGQVLDALEIDQAALVGHSSGSLVALEAAATMPERVRALGLLGIVIPMPVSDLLLTSTKADDHEAIDLLTNFGLARQSLMGGNPTPGLWMTGQGERLMERIPAGVMHANFCAAHAYEGGLAAAAKVTCPTVFVLGANDRMTPPKGAKPVIEAIKESVTVVIENCGHTMPAEAPDNVVTALKDVI